MKNSVKKFKAFLERYSISLFLGWMTFTLQEVFLTTYELRSEFSIAD